MRQAQAALDAAIGEFERKVFRGFMVGDESGQPETRSLLFYPASVSSRLLVASGIPRSSPREQSFDQQSTFYRAASIAVTTFAPGAVADEAPSLGLNGAVVFGFNEARGNSDTRGISGSGTFEYVTGGRGATMRMWLFVTREENDIRPPKSATRRACTSNYYWTEDDYFFGRLDWRKDNFGGVREEWVPSVGYGRVLMRTERHDLRGEIAAGYRFADLSDGTSEEGPALTGGVRYIWQISDSAEFFQNALVQWSSDNTFLESETGLTDTIIGNLSARFSYIVRHNTDVPADRANSDFFTNIGLEYKF
jgi:putative salt-induced outer membrane protein